MTQDHAATGLAASVDSLNAALESLVDDLGKERDALRRRASADDLEYIALRKSMAVEYVASLYQRLREALVASTGDLSIEDAISSLRSHSPRLGGRVERLLELTRACQLANQENGALIGAGLRNTQGALDSLRKLSAASATGTYSPSGRADVAGSSPSRLAVRA
jgi:flagellar biosynthesis/type III secretory pathway chaperone